MQEKAVAEDFKKHSSLTKFEDAVIQTGHGWFHYRLLFVSGCCLIALVFETMCISFVVPAAQCDFNITSSEKGILGAVMYVGMICSSHMWGFLADTKGRRKILILTLIADFICSVAGAFMPTVYLLIFMRFLNGFFICAPAAVIYAFQGEFHGDKTRTRATVWISVFMSLGCALEPVFAWLIITQSWSLDIGELNLNSWRIFLMLSGIPALIVAAMLFLMVPESPKYLLATGKHDDALDVLRYMFSVNTGYHKDNFPVKNLHLDFKNVYLADSNANPKSILGIIKHIWQQTSPLFVQPLLLPMVLSCFLQFGFYAISSGFWLWLPELLSRKGQYETNFPEDNATICQAISSLLELNTTIYNTTEREVVCTSEVSVSAFQNSVIISCFSSVGYALTGVLVQYVSRKLILVVNLVITAASGIAVLWSSTTLELILFPGLFVVLSGFCITVLNSIVIEVIPTYLRGMALCLTLCMGRLGTAWASVLLGELVDINCSAAVLVLSAVALVCGVLCLFLPSGKIEE